MDLALGLIETKGLVAAIEAADAMVKAADVKIISKEKVTGALIAIKVMGETAAVKASVDAGAAAAQRVGELVSVHVIPRPDDQIDLILFDIEKTEVTETSKIEKPSVIKSDIKKDLQLSKKVEIQSSEKQEKKVSPIKPKPVVKKTEISESNQNQINISSKKIPPMEQLVVLNVHALRRIARGFDNFPIKGREISKANRAKLLDYFKNLH